MRTLSNKIFLHFLNTRCYEIGLSEILLVKSQLSCGLTCLQSFNTWTPKWQKVSQAFHTGPARIRTRPGCLKLPMEAPRSRWCLGIGSLNYVFRWSNDITKLEHGPSRMLTSWILVSTLGLLEHQQTLFTTAIKTYHLDNNVSNILTGNRE